MIEERGANLSGGQRQRIAIARALATNPRILILDEATSALDYESERVIQLNMRRIVRDRTVIVVAHRLAAVRGCNRIVGIVDGRIVEVGSHEELIRSPGRALRLSLGASGPARGGRVVKEAARSIATIGIALRRRRDRRRAAQRLRFGSTRRGACPTANFLRRLSRFWRRRPRPCDMALMWIICAMVVVEARLSVFRPSSTLSPPLRASFSRPAASR